VTASLRLVETAAGDAGRGGLAQRLAALLRPEFTVEVIVPEPGDAVLGTPACQVPDCGRPSGCDGMCNAHRVRWVKAGRPDRQGWVATTDPVTAGFRPLAACTVAGCRFSQHRDRLCYRHSYAWRRQGRPGIDGWLAAAAPIGQAAAAAACAVEWCGLDAELAPPPLCRSHRARWRIHGRPSLEQFLFDCTHYGRPRFDLRGLKPQLRLEIQYALQCRTDERRTRTTPRSIHPLLRYLAQTNATSLLAGVSGLR
jgi:hypothetical protein